MRSRMHLIAVGVFVSGSLLLFAIGLFLIGDRRLLFARQFDLHAEFATVGGLQQGSAVRVGGMNAGEVTAIAIPSSPDAKFRVRMRIREALHPLVRTDSVASIQTDGIVGNRFIQIEAGSADAPVATGGGTIAGREPFEFADLLARSGAAIDNVSDTVVGLREELDAVLRTIGATAADARVLVRSIGGDVEAISQAGRRVSEDTQRIVEGVRAGRGTIGRLVTDDELYERARTIARDAEETVRRAREAAEQAQAIVTTVRGHLSEGDGSMGTIAAELRQTVTMTREAMSNLEENTEALKRNFLFRGYFENRGYYDLDSLTPAAYGQGALAGRHREPIRIWLRAEVLFARPTPQPASDGDVGPSSNVDVLSPEGRRRLDHAMAEVLRYPNDTPLIIEGFATAETRDERVRRSSERARQVRDYLRDRYLLASSRVSALPFADKFEEGVPGGAWDGVALAIWVDRRTLEDGRK